MKLGISAKLFGALLVISVVVCVSMGLAARVSFTRGFLGYLNEQGVARLESAVPNLAVAYQQHGSWDFLRSNIRAWFDAMRPVSTEPAEPDTAAGVHLRMTLLDANRQYVIGSRDLRSDAPMRPVVVAGKTVGWLALIPYEYTIAAADVRFQEQQLAANWIIGAGTVLMSALLAWWLSRILVTPLQRITQATHRLANGDYAGRVEVTSGDEIGLLSQDFNTLARTLGQNEQTRRRFMADVSHELRTPLAVLRGELEAIEDGVRQPNTQTVASLQAEVATLSKVVNDLYDLSLADVGALTFHMSSVDVSGLLRNTLRVFQQRLDAHELQLETQIAAGELTIEADERRLQQLFNNLLENMLRHTNTGGRLRIECRSEGGELCMIFQDSEPCVPADALPRLFDRFFRADPSRSRTSGGAGLGLAICRSIIEAHSGKITASASPLGGLCIDIRLPVAHSAEATE